jgi:GNAT superfamily N-acetyltransferase
MKRLATLADVDAVAAMGERFRATTGYRDTLAANPAQLAALATRLIDAPDGDVIVADVDGALVGMLALLVYAHHMSGERIAGELAWWVDPAHRGIGVRLLRAAEAWAQARGAVALQLIAPTPAVERLVERLGYTPVERTYQRRFA